MSDDSTKGTPPLRLLKFKRPQQHTCTVTPDNSWTEEILDSAKAFVEQTTERGEHITGLAVIYCTSDGVTGHFCNGGDPVRLAGAAGEFIHALHHVPKDEP